MIIEDTGKTPRKVLMDLLGVTATNFQKLKQAGVFQAQGHGAYDLRDAIQAWLKFNLDGAKPGDLTEARRMLAIAQEQKVQLDIQERQRELVSLPEAQNAFNKVLAMIAAKLDGLPGRMAGPLAGMTDPAAIRDTLFRETRAIRDDAAAEIESWATAGPGGRRAEAPTTEDGGPVGG